MIFRPVLCIIFVKSFKEELFMPIFQDQKGKNISSFQKMIEEKKNTIRKYYDEIGHLYYGQYKDVNVDMTKDINARCERIKNYITNLTQKENQK